VPKFRVDLFTTRMFPSFPPCGRDSYIGRFVHYVVSFIFSCLGIEEAYYSIEVDALDEEDAVDTAREIINVSSDWPLRTKVKDAELIQKEEEK